MTIDPGTQGDPVTRTLREDPCRDACAECGGTVYCEPSCDCGCRLIDDLLDTLTVAFAREGGDAR